MRRCLAPARPRSTVLGHILSIAARRLRGRFLSVRSASHHHSSLVEVGVLATCPKLRPMGVFWSHAGPVNSRRNSNCSTEASGLCRSAKRPNCSFSMPRSWGETCGILHRVLANAVQQLEEALRWAARSTIEKASSHISQGFAIVAVSRLKERGDPWQLNEESPTAKPPAT
jgi:hypothetical protein